MLSRAREAGLLLTLWVALFTGASQFLIVAPILKSIGTTLAIPEGIRGTLATGYAVAVAVTALVAGPVSDQVGRRAVVRAGAAAMAVSLLLHAFARDYASLLALRVLAGASSGLFTATALAYVGDVFPQHRRGFAMGVVSSGMAFGQILGIPLGTVLSHRAGFQTPFVVFGVLMTVATALTFVFLAPTPGAPRRLTLASAARSYVDLLGQAAPRSMTVASATMMFSVSAFIVYQPTWLEDHLGATGDQIALLFAVGGVANALAGPLAGRLSDRVGRQGLVVGGSVGLALMMASIPFLPSLGWAYPVFFLTMGMVGMRIGPFNAWIADVVDAGHRGTLMNLTMAVGQAGFAVGSALAGPAYGTFGFVGNGTIAAVGALATAAVLAQVRASRPKDGGHAP